MLKKLLNLFKTKEELELDIDEFVQWLKTKKTSTIESLEPVCKDLLSNLKEYLDEFQANLDNLQKAEIKDKDKIEQRIIAIVLGNRKSFIDQSDFLLKRINPPDYENINQIIEFSGKLKNELDNFAKITHKSFYTSQHLFYKEVENIKKTINKISKLNGNFDEKISQSKINQIKDFENNINLFKDAINTKYIMVKDLGKLKSRLQQAKENKNNYLEKVKQIKISPTFKYYLENKDKLNQSLDKIKRHKLNLEHNFAVIDYALKKYTKIADEEFKLIHAYQTDAFDALLKDKELKIIEVLQKVTHKVLENKLVLKDSKKQKILAEINIINRDYLGKLIEKYNRLEKERRKIQEEINENKIIKELDETDEKIQNLNKEMELIEKDINNINKNINKVNYEGMKKVIEEEFDVVFGIKLKLKMVEDDQ